MIPKVVFESCDETSIKIKWDNLRVEDYKDIKLQYKEVHEQWEEAKEFDISVDSLQVDLDSRTGEAVDLKPGTPYFIRLTAIEQGGEKIVGPETVFDTKPIDCTPKKKKCTIS